VPLTPDPSVIARMEMFRELERDDLEDVVRRARTRRVAKGTRIFSQGDEAATCYALIDGRVKIVQSGAEGEQMIVHFIGPGDMFGTLAVFTGGGYPADAEAVTDCVEITWTADTMIDLMHRHPKIATNTLNILGRRLMQVQRRLREISNQRVERRIAHALLRLVRQAGRPVDSGTAIDFPLSRQDVAEMTGTTLHTVSRTLSTWEERGLVELGRQHVVVRDPAALTAIAEDLQKPDSAAGPAAPP
jgi:CRP/FNR family transcriptional regulator, nitrogen oxide reductase regulator